MSDLTPAAQRHLMTHHGVITKAELRSCDVGPGTVQRLVDREVLRHVQKWVYVSTAAPPTLAQRCAIVCGAHPSGFVTGPTAGMLLGLRRMPVSTAIHLALANGLHLPLVPGVRVRRSRKLLSSDAECRDDGIRIASPSRLAFDLARDLRPIDHLSVIEQLRQRGLVTADELRRVGQRLCHPARPGSRTFEWTVSQLRGAAADSHPEVVVAAALRDRGVPVEPQLQLVRADGRKARLDLAVSAVRWGVELDIHPEHGSYDGRGRDARRYRSLHLDDWQVEPVSEADLDDVEALADELVALYVARCQQFATPTAG